MASKHTLKPGYAFKLMRRAQPPFTSSEDWEIMLASKDVCDSVRYCGATLIDGADCAVFQHMDADGQYDGTYYAQTKVIARD